MQRMKYKINSMMSSDSSVLETLLSPHKVNTKQEINMLKCQESHSFYFNVALKLSTHTHISSCIK